MILEQYKILIQNGTVEDWRIDQTGCQQMPRQRYLRQMNEKKFKDLKDAANRTWRKRKTECFELVIEDEDLVWLNKTVQVQPSRIYQKIQNSNTERTLPWGKLIQHGIDWTKYDDIPE